MNWWQKEQKTAADSSGDEWELPVVDTWHEAFGKLQLPPVVENAKDGSLKAFIPDPADPAKLDVGTTASGIAADDAGSIYAADVAAHNLRKYVKVK